MRRFIHSVFITNTDSINLWGKVSMYDLRRFVRYRLSSLLIASKSDGSKNVIQLLDKYEDIILEEIENNFMKLSRKY